MSETEWIDKTDLSVKLEKKPKKPLKHLFKHCAYIHCPNAKCVKRGRGVHCGRRTKPTKIKDFLGV